MNIIHQLLKSSDIHNDWQPLLINALSKVDESYLSELVNDDSWLPGQSLIFSAFKRDLKNCRYILFGESPYPRKESANGIAFYDAAVTELWSANGLSKGVNKATSLRNIMKCALLAEGHLALDADGKITQSAIACLDKSQLINSMDDFFTALEKNGFLLLNTAPVLQPLRKPAIEARFWQPFIHQLLLDLQKTDLQQLDQAPTLVLWGKVAQQIEALPISKQYQKIVSEHPYNLSFINNPDMQLFFAQLKLLSL